MNEDIPIEMTDDGRCPDCGAGMQPADPWNSDCEILCCGQCGFNDPKEETDA